MKQAVQGALMKNVVARLMVLAALVPAAGRAQQQVVPDAGAPPDGPAAVAGTDAGAPAPPPPPPATRPPPPATSSQAPAATPIPEGQWVWTSQYGWVWMPFASSYTYAPADGSTPLMYLYGPAVGWSWVMAPWVWGAGPWPWFAYGGPARYGWYGHAAYGYGYGHGGYRYGYGGYPRPYPGAPHGAGPGGPYARPPPPMRPGPAYRGGWSGARSAYGGHRR
jgi:hypothetical protein